MAVNQQQLDEWLDHPVTREFRARLVRERQRLMEDWAAGMFIEETEFKSAISGAVAVHHCKVLETLLDLTPESFDEQ